MGNDEYSEVSSRPWHLLISGGKDIAERSKEAKFLRTVVLYKSSWVKESCQLSGEQLNNLFDALQCLRVLSLSGYDITMLPDSIRKLKCLRFLDLSHTAITQLSDSFLDLSHTAITKLPVSVRYLNKLQKLLLSHCYGLTELPDSFRYLKNLQFIDISHTAITMLSDSVTFLPSLQIVLPENMGKLINLRPLDSRGEFPEVEGQEFPLPIIANTQLHDYIKNPTPRTLLTID
ncbi:hypothetical protein Q3G72_003129 [Acer saccharum]|nr:hypothetical protein Q3G72_003129 [Acer saccharum]